jgi:glyoxylase-like metal-dependent hydrolase (beta-lactamase superfamily II)
LYAHERQLGFAISLFVRQSPAQVVEYRGDAFVGQHGWSGLASASSVSDSAKLAGRGVKSVATLFTAQAGSLQDARGFEAFYPGPGHAVDNIAIRIGSVLFAGCFLKSNDATDLGFTGAADLRAWPASIRRLRDKYGLLTIVPGHGPVDREGVSYQHTLDLLGAAAK